MWSYSGCIEIENRISPADCAIAAVSLININVIVVLPHVQFVLVTRARHIYMRTAWQLDWLCYITTHVARLSSAHRTYSGWLICTGSSCCSSYIDGLCHCEFHIRRAGSTGSNELFCPAYAEGCGKTELDRFVRWRLFPSARPQGTSLKSRLCSYGIPYFLSMKGNV